jgi:hypothetical protein
MRYLPAAFRKACSNRDRIVIRQEAMAVRERKLDQRSRRTILVDARFKTCPNHRLSGLVYGHIFKF